MPESIPPSSRFGDAWWFLLLVTCTVVVWYLPHPFFFYDEWDLLDEFVSGRVDVFSPHNEHLYIFGKPLYYFLVSTFVDALTIPHTLLLLVHAANAWMVGKMVMHATNRTIGLGAAFVFALHPFHIDNVHMLIQVSALLQQTFFLLSLHCVLLYVAMRQKRWLMAIPLLQVIQIGWFGTSLVSDFLIIPIAALLFVRSGAPWKRLVPLVLGLILAVGLYWHLGAHRIEATFAANGTEWVGALRLILGAWAENFPRVMTGFVFHPPFPVLILAWGTFLALAATWFYRSSSDRYQQDLPYVGIGFLLYLAYLIPIGLTRHSFGADIGIATRYTYYYLPGILLLVGVFLHPLLQNGGVILRKSAAVLFGLYILGMIIGARYATGIWDDRNVANRTAVETGGPNPVLSAHPSMAALRMKAIYDNLKKR